MLKINTNIRFSKQLEHKRKNKSWKEIYNKTKVGSAIGARYYNHGVDWADNDTAIIFKVNLVTKQHIKHTITHSKNIMAGGNIKKLAMEV